MRSIESDKLQALWMRWVCSMYSDILCRKLSGSLNTTGIAILDSSCECTRKRHTNEQTNEQIKPQWWTLAWTSRVTLITSLIRLLQHIFNQNPFCPDSFWSHVPIFFFWCTTFPKPIIDEQIKDQRFHMWPLSSVAHVTAQNITQEPESEAEQLQFFTVPMGSEKRKSWCSLVLV